MVTFVDSQAAEQLATPAIRQFVRKKSFSIEILFLIVLLVAALHVLGLIRCLRPEQAANVAKPMPIAVSMVSVVKPTPEAKPTPTPPPNSTKPPRKKIQVKPKLKKTEPIAAPADFSDMEQVLAQQPVVNAASMPSATSDDSHPAKADILPYTEAYVSPAYQHNPKPEYPAIARNRDWQGKVLLQVQVDADGNAVTVEVAESSTHEILDESAIEAVKQWRFVPAKRGENNVGSSVLIPIIFTLQDQDGW